jgi:pimeloyl-ACP methyl ester carboxylesterase
VRKAVEEAGLAVAVEPACWSHGYRRSIADQCDRAHARAEGERLAAKVLALRTTCPGRPVYLLAHSAGAAVALAAAAYLPPDSVERIVLLAPTVSAHADLRPALRCARLGVDVYYSGRDYFACLVGFTLIGAEGRLIPRVAGRVGFLHPRECAAEDECLYRKLWQHAWEPSWACTGHDGGHYGVYAPGFLSDCVLPMLAGP